MSGIVALCDYMFSYFNYAAYIIIIILKSYMGTLKILRHNTFLQKRLSKYPLQDCEGQLSITIGSFYYLNNVFCFGLVFETGFWAAEMAQRLKARLTTKNMRDRVSMCVPSCPEILSVDQTDFTLRDLPFSAS